MTRRDPLLEVSEVAGRFRFEFKPSYRAIARGFGVLDRTALVSVTQHQFVARFGPWQVSTPLGNIFATELSGPFSYLKTAGPPHLTFSDHGLTFATTDRQGLLIRFREPVRGLDPFGLLRHPNLTVTVLGRDELAAALQHGASAEPPVPARGSAS